MEIHPTTLSKPHWLVHFSSFLMFCFSIFQNLGQALHIFFFIFLLSLQFFKLFVALLLLNHHSKLVIEKDHRPLQYLNEATPTRQCIMNGRAQTDGLFCPGHWKRPPTTTIFHCGQPHLTVYYEGESANAVPNSHKLCSRVPHIRGNRRLQLPRSAMRKSRPGGTALLITVSSEPGKYAFDGLIFHHEITFPSFQPGFVLIKKKCSFCN